MWAADEPVRVRDVLGGLREHGTVLREFYRAHFHRGRVEDLPGLNRSLQVWVHDYAPRCAFSPPLATTERTAAINA